MDTLISRLLYAIINSESGKYSIFAYVIYAITIIMVAYYGFDYVSKNGIRALINIGLLALFISIVFFLLIITR